MLSSPATRAGEEGSEERSWIRLLWRRGVEGALGASLAVLRGFGPVVGWAMAAAWDMKRIFFRGTVGALNCLGMRGQVGGLRHGWLLAIVHEFLWQFAFSLCSGCDSSG